MLVAEYTEGEPPSYWLDGSDSVAYVQILKPSTLSPPWYQGARQWIAKHIGVGYTPPRGVHVSVRVVNRKTKATTFESVEPLGHPIMVSPTGRLLTSATDDNGIAVWDTAPGPRWPWSLAAGGSVLGLSWFVGRCNRRRLQKGSCLSVVR